MDITHFLITHRYACLLFKAVAKAVQHMHNRGIVHNDLKPENLLLTTDSEDACLKVTDFGESYFTDEYFKQMEERGESVEEEIEMESEAPAETSSFSDMRQFRTSCSSVVFENVTSFSRFYHATQITRTSLVWLIHPARKSTP